MESSPHLTLRCHFCATWNRVEASRVKDRPKCGKCRRPMLVDRPWTLHDDSFQRTVEGTDIPVVVDFYADWCGPCKMMAPSFDQLAKAYEGRVLVAKLNTDLSPTTSERFQIRGIPTTIVFKNGAEFTRVTGAMPSPTLQELVDSALAGAPPRRPAAGATEPAR